jgi:hypothetical protein
VRVRIYQKAASRSGSKSGFNVPNPKIYPGIMGSTKKKFDYLSSEVALPEPVIPPVKKYI